MFKRYFIPLETAERLSSLTVIVTLAGTLALSGVLLTPGVTWAKAGEPTVEMPDQAVQTESLATDKKAEPDPSDPKTQALDVYNRGVDLFKIAQLQANKGDTRAQERVLKEAIKKFEAALALNPELVEAQSNIGFAWLTLKKHDRAIAAFEKALLQSPHHLATLNGLATTYAFDNQIDKAVTMFEQLVTLAPGQPDFAYNMGSVLQKAGRMAEAEAAYQQALKARPDHQRSLFNLGTLKENQGQLEEALEFYSKAKSADVGNTIGLEAIRRIEGIEQALSQGVGPMSNPAQAKSAQQSDAQDASSSESSKGMSRFNPFKRNKADADSP